MANGTPDPTNTASQNWGALLQKLGPILATMSKQQQPQGGGTPPVPGMAPPMPAPPTLGQCRSRWPPAAGGATGTGPPPRAG